MQPCKVLALDLLGKGEVGLLLLLEPLMIKRRFVLCDHIVHAVRRFRYEQMPQHRHTALGACLTELQAGSGGGVHNHHYQPRAPGGVGEPAAAPAHDGEPAASAASGLARRPDSRYRGRVLLQPAARHPLHETAQPAD